MVDTIDHYGYWQKSRINEKIVKREQISLKLIRSLKIKKARFLDVGCGNGKFMKVISKIFPGYEVSGIDYSKNEVNEARKSGLDVVFGNIEKGINKEDNYYDIVYAGEVIEHLYNSDYFLSEVNRILRPGGYLILTTPNLLAWFNRVLSVIGIQPLFLEPSTKSKLVGSGFLSRFKKESAPVGHVRIFTLAALKDMLSMNGFKFLTIKGNVYEEGFPKALLYLDNIFKIISPKLSAGFILMAKKFSNNENK
jgi:SAM-dependent methyltransferase